MRLLKILLFLFFLSSIQAQEKLLLKKELISDWSKFPIYNRLTSNETKPNYIDSINVYAITYLSDGLKVNGFLVKPKKDGKYPCIIYNRGGNREFGSLKPVTGLFKLGKIAKEGYIIIASQYRGNGGSEGQEEFGGKEVNDILVLTDVLKEIKNADINKIGMYGWSRGGIMTYIALTKTTKIKAAVVGGAVSDLHLTIKNRPIMEEKVIAELIPNYENNKKEELNKRSAIKWVDKFPKNVPILMLHGNSDWRVKPEHSLKLALEFEKHRVPYRLIMFEGGDHGIKEHKNEVNYQIINWFNKYLKNNQSLPNMQYHGK